MYWISWAYLGDAGIKADIIKANIWRKRSECACFDTGKNEFTEAMSLLRNGKVKTGSVFLLKAAENGDIRCYSRTG